MILVPMDTPGVTIVRHADGVRLRRRAARPRRDRCSRTCACRRRNMLLGEGRGFEIAQGRLGPGPHPPLHAPDRRWPSARSKRCASARSTRVAFGKPLAEQGVDRASASPSRACEIEQARLLTLKAAYMMDTVGNKAARGRDRDDQGGRAEHGAARDRPGDPGARRRPASAQDFRLAYAWAHARTLRLADGPDEVHRDAHRASSSCGSEPDCRAHSLAHLARA